MCREGASIKKISQQGAAGRRKRPKKGRPACVSDTEEVSEMLVKRRVPYIVLFHLLFSVGCLHAGQVQAEGSSVPLEKVKWNWEIDIM